MLCAAGHRLDLNATLGVDLDPRESRRERRHGRLPDGDHGQLARERAAIRQLHRLQLAAIALERSRNRLLDQPHALAARQLQLVRVATHVGLGTAVQHGDVGDAQLREFARRVDRRVAAADHDRVLHAGQRITRHEFHALDPCHRAHDAFAPCTGHVERRVGTQAAAQEHRVVLREQVVDRKILPDLDAGLDRDAERCDELHLARAAFGRHLVRCHPRHVKPARDLALLVHRHVAALERQIARARQRRRPRPHTRHALAVRRRLGQQPGGDALGHDRLGRIALQAADRDRRALPRVVDARAGTQHLDRADARARVTQQVRGQDRARRSAHVLGRDLADERRDVDAGGTRGDARRVVAIEAAIRLGDGFAIAIERLQVTESRFESAIGQQAHVGRHAHERTTGWFAKCVGVRAMNRPAPFSAMSLPFSNATRPPTMVRSMRPLTS